MKAHYFYWSFIKKWHILDTKLPIAGIPPFIYQILQLDLENFKLFFAKLYLMKQILNTDMRSKIFAD